VNHVPNHDATDFFNSLLENDQKACAEALRYAGELLKWSTALINDSSQLRVSVMNDAGFLLFTVVAVVVNVAQVQQMAASTRASETRALEDEAVDERLKQELFKEKDEE
jgi:hypothetical protein